MHQHILRNKDDVKFLWDIETNKIPTCVSMWVFYYIVINVVLFEKSF